MERRHRRAAGQHPPGRLLADGRHRPGGQRLGRLARPHQGRRAGQPADSQRAEAARRQRPAHQRAAGGQFRQPAGVANPAVGLIDVDQHVRPLRGPPQPLSVVGRQRQTDRVAGVGDRQHDGPTHGPGQGVEVEAEAVAVDPGRHPPHPTAVGDGDLPKQRRTRGQQHHRPAGVGERRQHGAERPARPVGGQHPGVGVHPATDGFGDGHPQSRQAGRRRRAEPPGRHPQRRQFGRRRGLVQVDDGGVGRRRQERVVEQPRRHGPQPAGRACLAPAEGGQQGLKKGVRRHAGPPCRASSAIVADRPAGVSTRTEGTQRLHLCQ